MCDDDGGVSHDESENVEWESIGMLFEGLHPTILKGFMWGKQPLSNSDLAITELSNTEIEWEQRKVWGNEAQHATTGNSKSNNIVDTESSFVCAVVRCIDDIPGAVTSGHYLWPSSLALCDYLVANRHVEQRKEQIRSVLELGAGSGIVSIVASQIFVDALQVVVVTDCDRTTLERAQENFEASVEEQKRHGNYSRAIRTEFLQLRWGSNQNLENMTKCLNTTETRELHEHNDSTPNETRNNQIHFDLVLGSDLIDRAEIVQSLFFTVDAALNQTNNKNKSQGIFLLSQSFAYDSETEAEIDRVCKRFHLVRRVLQTDFLDTNSKQDSVGKSNDGRSTTFLKIQEFKRQQ